MQVQFLHCDNAGENQAFKQTCIQGGLWVDFKYTTPGLPQQDGHVEWKFATLFNQVHAMFNSEKFTTYLQNGLWAKAANTTTVLKNNLITPNRNISSFEQFLGREREAS